MRDQPSTTAATTAAAAAITADVLDFLGDEENAETNAEKLTEAVSKITQPSSELINPTLDSGANTAKFLLLLEQLQLANKSQKTESMKGLLSAINEISKVNSIQRKAVYDARTYGKSESESEAINPATTQVYETLKSNHRAKMALWTRYSKVVESARGHLDTLVKVSRSLLHLQETTGSGVQADRMALGKYTIAIKLLDGEWASLRANFVEVEVCKAEMEAVGDLRGIVKVKVEDPETGGVKVVEVGLAGLSLGLLRAQEDTGKQEEEKESDGEVVIDLDEENEELGAGTLPEGENEW